MPVMMSTITIESWSSCNATSTESLPVGIHSKSVSTYGTCMASPAPRMAAKIINATAKVRKSTPGPMIETSAADGWRAPWCVP